MSPSMSAGCAAALLPLLALFANTVNAHGNVDSFTDAGKKYSGPRPVDQAGVVTSQSAIRQIASESPVLPESWNGPMIACGQNSSAPATVMAPVAAGSTLSVQWVNGDGGVDWPHVVGPLMTYMAPCSKSDCSDDPTTLDFFKISQDGQVAGDNSKWVQAQLAAGKPYDIKVPSAIPSGAYIMRHEIINLARASISLPEAYPSCFNLQVTGGGSGSTTPTAFVASLGSKATVKFPGAYSLSDPGMQFSPYAPYTSYADIFPGPAIPAQLASGGGGGGGGNSTVPTTSASLTTTTKSAGTPATTTVPIGNPASSPATSSPSSSSPAADAPLVFTTTITKVMVLTMTIGDDGPTTTSKSAPNNAVKPTTTTHSLVTSTLSSSGAHTTTSVVVDDDGCEEFEETTTSVAPTATIARRHRRSERWRPAGSRS